MNDYQINKTPIKKQLSDRQFWKFHNDWTKSKRWKTMRAK